MRHMLAIRGSNTLGIVGTDALVDALTYHIALLMSEVGCKWRERDAQEASTPTHVMLTLGLSGFRHPLQTSPDGWMIGSHAYSTPRDSFAYPTEPPPRLMHAVL
jgi:hypothetical protein